MTLRIALTAALFVGLTSPLVAEQRPVVIELYTSQGCSSCPPADAILGELSGRSDVIALALHVDYWDYIGWKDEFGDPAHAKRQRAYASYAGRRAIYTPEMVVNGETDIVGTKPMALSNAIAKYKAKAPRMTLETKRNGDTLTIKGSALAGASGPMEVHLLRVFPKQQIKITRGENRGSTYEYTNIAHDLQTLGAWNGQSPLDMKLTVTGDESVVVLVQEAGPGPIVAAARLD